MKQVLLVFIGGGVGSALRYLVGKFLKMPASGFPWSTFSVNVLGSLIIGILMGVTLKNSALSENQTLLLITGLCGGFTTFSAFSMDLFTLMEKRDIAAMALYLGGSLLGGLAAFIIGFMALRA